MGILHIDYTKCIGCETCEMVCGSLYGKPNIVMSRMDDGRVVPLYCRHCPNPGCARACTRGAIVKTEDGTVILQSALCEGCTTKDCLQGCPFLGIYPGKEIKCAPNKCDMCLRQQEKGLLPACVSMCPCNALSVQTHESVKSLDQKVKDADKVVLQHIKQLRGEIFGNK